MSNPYRNSPSISFFSLPPRKREKKKGGNKQNTLSVFFQSDSTEKRKLVITSRHDDAPISKKVKQFPLYTLPTRYIGNDKSEYLPWSVESCAKAERESNSKPKEKRRKARSWPSEQIRKIGCDVNYLQSIAFGYRLFRARGTVPLPRRTYLSYKRLIARVLSRNRRTSVAQPADEPWLERILEFSATISGRYVNL